MSAQNQICQTQPIIQMGKQLMIQVKIDKPKNFVSGVWARVDHQANTKRR